MSTTALPDPMQAAWQTIAALADAVGQMARVHLAATPLTAPVESVSGPTRQTPDTPTDPIAQARALEATARRLRRESSRPDTDQTKPDPSNERTNDSDSVNLESQKSPKSFVRSNTGISAETLAECLDLPERTNDESGDLPGLMVPVSADNDTLTRIGHELLKILGKPRRALTKHEKRRLSEHSELLTDEALARLAAWYPNGRGRRRRKPDALVFLLEDLPVCLDAATPRGKLTTPKRGSSIPPDFREWLADADLGNHTGFRDAPAAAWQAAPVRKLYQEHKAKAA